MLGFVAWLALLAAAAALLGQAFQFDLALIVAGFLVLPALQQAAIGAVALVVLSLMAFAISQSWRLARLNSHGDRAGFQSAIAVAGASQNDFDGALQHILSSDPEESISSLNKQIAETEARTATQRGRNRAVDLQERLEEIRHRQQSLREQIGEVAESRRAIEPVLEELKDRQRQLERSLDKIETDENNHNLTERLTEFDQNIAKVKARHTALLDCFAALNRFKDELTKSQSELGPLQKPEAGMTALLGELEIQGERLVKEIEQLETGNGDNISVRVEALDAGKKDAEHRVVRLEGSYAVLDNIRRDFIELRSRQDDLRHAFAEIETDASGKSLADRLAELEEFSSHTRLRLRSLQEALTTLNRFRRDLIDSQTQLAPLQAPGEGINAAIVELDSRCAQIMVTLGELEVSGGEKLGSRVEAFAESKRLTEQRIAQVFEHFERLDSLRNEIARTFANLNTALNKLG